MARRTSSSSSSTSRLFFPDLSLNIRPPEYNNCNEEAKALQVMMKVNNNGLFINNSNTSEMCSSTSDSGSSESDLSHDNNAFFLQPRSTDQPKLFMSLGINTNNNNKMVHNINPHHFNHHQYHHQPQIYGRDKFKRNGRVVNVNGVIKRSVRAPRMRWTTTLHSHFVHAVQLLGGHESKYIYCSSSLINFIHYYHALFILLINFSAL